MKSKLSNEIKENLEKYSDYNCKKTLKEIAKCVEQ